MKTIDDVKEAFDTAYRVAEEFQRTHPDDAAYVDLSGLLRDEAARAAMVKRSLVSEVPNEVGQTMGSMYVLEQSNVTQRSYSTPKILASFLEAMNQTEVASLSDVLKWLMSQDVVKLSWSWTQLRKQAQLMDIPLVIVGHEIDDNEFDAHVGEYTKLGSPRFIPRG